MANETYDVEARLKLEAGDSERQARKLSDTFFELGRRIRGTGEIGGGFARTMIGIGASYIGIRAVGSALEGGVKSAFSFRAQLERTKIGLASVLSAVEGTSFAEGMQKGEQVFKDLTSDAIKSTATTKELFDIYQMILGPVRATGKGLQFVREMTNDTVSAASALNIPFDQASREINMMLRGSAGMHNVLFAMLKSTGAIKESAEDFNKLTQVQRVEVLSAAMKKFSSAADAYGKSWAGVTSTFRDIVDQMGSTAIAPVFQKIKGALGGFNDKIIANREQISEWMTALGERFAAHVGHAMERGGKAIEYVTSHWGEISARIHSAVGFMRDMIPHLERAARAWLVFSVGRKVVGAGVTAAGYAAKAAEGYTATVAPWMGMAFGGGAGLYGGAGGAAGAGAGAGAAGAVAPLTAALGPLAAVAALVAGAIGVVQEQWVHLTAIFDNSTGGLLKEVIGLGAAIGKFLFPILKVFAHLITVPLAGAFAMIVPVLHAVVYGWRLIFEVLGEATGWLYEKVRPAFDWFYEAIQRFSRWINQAADDVNRWMGDHGFAGRQRNWRDGGAPYSDEKANKEFMDALADTVNGTRGTQYGYDTNKYKESKPPAPVFDFKGAKIEVRQEFRDADPDRVLVQMIDDLHRQAEMRTRSGFAPALTG